MGKLFAFARGAALGAGIMYLFDPNLGKTRRALLRDKAVKAINDADKFADKASADLGNRISGAVAEARSHIPRPSADVKGRMRPGPAMIACLTGSLICLTGLRQRGIRGLVMLLSGAALASRTANASISQPDQTMQPNGQSTNMRKQRVPSSRAA